MDVRNSSSFSLSKFTIVTLLLGLFFGCASSLPVSKQFGNKGFDNAVSDLARHMVEQGGLQDKPVLISPHDFYDLNSKLSLPLAVLLREKMITEMKKLGVRVLLPGVDEDRFMIMQGTWVKQREDIIVNIKVMELKEHGPEAVAAASSSFTADQMDPTFLTPDRESWARYIVRKLESKARDQSRRSAHIRTFSVSGKTGSSAGFGGYLSEWLGTALVESRLFIPIDQSKELKKLPVSTIRTRGTRGIRPVATSLTADLLKADTEISGGAWIHRKDVEIRVSVSDRQGRQISAAMADVPIALFPENLIKEPIRFIEAELPKPSTGYHSSNLISKGGLHLDITTDRGEVHPFYHQGETIRFIIRLNRSAHLYLFDLDPKGKATLLYPVDSEGTLLRRKRPELKPGIPLILPEDGSSYDLIVAEPFGKDTVWAVASETELQFPPGLAGAWSHGETLIKRIRLQGLSSGWGYAESQVEILTGF